MSIRCCSPGCCHQRCRTTGEDTSILTLNEYQDRGELVSRNYRMRHSAHVNFFVPGFTCLMCSVIAIIIQAIGYNNALDVQKAYVNPDSISHITDESLVYQPITIYKLWPGVSGGVIFALLGVVTILVARYWTKALLYSALAMSIITFLISCVTLASVATIVSDYGKFSTNLRTPQLAVQRSYAAQVCMAMGAVLVTICVIMIVTSSVIFIQCCMASPCCGCVHRESSEFMPSAQDDQSQRQIFTIHASPVSTHYYGDDGPLTAREVALPGLPTYDESQQILAHCANVPV